MHLCITFSLREGQAVRKTAALRGVHSAVDSVVSVVEWATDDRFEIARQQANPEKQLENPLVIPVAPKLVPCKNCAAIFLAPKSQLAENMK